MSLSHVQSFALHLQSSEPQHTARGMTPVIQKPNSCLLGESASVFLPSPDSTFWLGRGAPVVAEVELWSVPLLPLPPGEAAERACFTAPKALNRWSLAALRGNRKGFYVEIW